MKTNDEQKYFGSMPKAVAIEMATMDLMLAMGRTPPPATYALYASLLSTLSISQLEEGFSRAMMTSKSWLTPGDLRELCLGVTDADHEQGIADEAYAMVIAYLRYHGVAGRMKPGAVLTFEPTMTFGPDVPAPELTKEVKGTLVSLGGCSTRA